MSQILIQVAPVTPAEAFLVSAEAFMDGVRVLHVARPIPAIALTFIAGHTLESGLKAFLSKRGISDRILSKKPYGHDLIGLWTESEKRGLEIGSLPDWVTQLAGVYGPPHVVRYPIGLNGLVLPNLSALMSGLEDLMSCVRTTIRS